MRLVVGFTRRLFAFVGWGSGFANWIEGFVRCFGNLIQPCIRFAKS
jgi:hypothetical protein